MLSDAILIVNALITLFIGVVLVLVVRQLSVLQKSLHAATLVATQAHARDFAQLIVQDESMRSMLNYSRWQASTNMILHEMEARYQLWQAGVTDDATWQADVAYINKYRGADFVRTALQESAHEFRPDFIAYLAGKAG